MSRRTLLLGGLLAPPLLNLLALEKPSDKKHTSTKRLPLPSDIHLLDLRHDFEEYNYRAPYQFGGRTVDRVTLLNVRVKVETPSGRNASGFGSMPLGNAWSFPSQVVSYDQTLEAMKRLATEIRDITAAYSETAHPIDIAWELEPAFLNAATALSGKMKLSEPIPKLCTLVVASSFDAAIHDAYGKANGINCYQGYGPQYMSHDLSFYLGPKFKGEYLDQYLLKKPTESIYLYHSIGASDPIFASDIKHRIGDGLPETLDEWIQSDGVTHLKIKLNGADLKVDVDRMIQIDKAATEAQRRRGVTQWKYCCDFNERCKDVNYLLTFLEEIKRQSPASLTRLQYIEQPTARDLKSNLQNVMHAAAKIVPVVIDESLVDLESYQLSRQLGYTGVALKVCKGQTNALLMAAAAQKFKSFLCVQDLTCPGASLIQSAGFAAHIPGVSTIEANSRQYVPSANEKWKDRFPSIFEIHNGQLGTGVLTGPGLGAV